MAFFKIMLLVVCVLAVLGAGSDVGDDGGKLRGYVALFVGSGVLFLAAWALTNLPGA